MENKKIIVGIFVLMAVQLASAISVEIDIGNNFEVGDKLSFNYTIFSEQEQEIEYIASVYCPNAPLGMLDVIKISLKPGIPFTDTHVYMSNINYDIEPQECKAVVGIIIPEEISEEKSFQIVTNPSFECQLLTCESENCFKQSKVFTLGENIYFDYISEVQEPLLKTILIYPNKSVEQLTLPISIKVDQIGTYELEAIFSKEGYKDVEQFIQFGVIKEPAEIHKGFLPSINENNSKGEDFGFNWLFLFIIILILVVICFLIRKKSIR